MLADVGGHLAPGRDLPLVAADPDPALAPPPSLAVPELLGWVYEATLAPAERRRRGAFYTPAPLAASLAAATLDGLGPGARVWDPAVGGGALLLAAARLLIGLGADPLAVVGSQLGGVDADPVAVDVAITALGVLGGVAPTGIGVGDGLAARPATWDAVIANPPFLGQLKRDTARSRSSADALGRRFGAAASGYADDAGLFLLAALGAVRTGGRIGFVLPAPLVATRDGAPVRRAVGGASSLVRLWSPGATASGFDAGVRIVLAVARTGAVLFSVFCVVAGAVGGGARRGRPAVGPVAQRRRPRRRGRGDRRLPRRVLRSRGRGTRRRRGRSAARDVRVDRPGPRALG